MRVLCRRCPDPPAPADDRQRELAAETRWLREQRLASYRETRKLRSIRQRVAADPFPFAGRFEDAPDVH